MTDIRQSSIKLLTSTLSNTEGSNGADQASNLAQQLEQAVFEVHHGNTGNAYRDQLRSLHLDLSKNNVDLAKQLVSGQVSAQELIQAGPEVSCLAFIFCLVVLFMLSNILTGIEK